ncbi:MAG: SdrD B-like domain-containing protein [Chloroflexota bacterium]
MHQNKQRLLGSSVGTRWALMLLMIAVSIAPNFAYTTAHAQENEVLVGNPDLCFAISDGYFQLDGTEVRDGNAEDTLGFLNRVTGNTNPVTGEPPNTGTNFIEAMSFRPGGTTLYATDGDTLGTVNLLTGLFTAIGDAGASDSSVTDIDGLSFDPTTGRLWGTERNSGTTADQLLELDPATGAVLTGPTNVQLQEGLGDLDDLAIDPIWGTFYAIQNQGGGPSNLAIIDPSNGNTTTVGKFTRQDTGEQISDMEGLAFFNDGQLYGSTGKDWANGRNVLWRIDKTTAVVELIGEFTSRMSDIEALDCLTAPSFLAIEKATNGVDADDAPGVLIPIGNNVVWSYFLRNTGGQLITNIVVTDDNGTPGNTADDITVCTIPQLTPGQSNVDVGVTCEVQGTATNGQYTNVATATGESVGETLTQQDPSNYFGYNPAALGDYTWIDVNLNGIQEAFEPPLPNVVVTLHNANDNSVVGTMTTDASGFYLFDNLAPGDYYLVFDLTTNTNFTTFTTQDAGSDDAVDSDVDPNGRTPNINLSSGETDRTWDAGVDGTGILASLGDFVWHDLNGNGIQDNGEPGIEGVSVQLFDINNNPVDPPGPGGSTTTTDANGAYSFDNLLPGDYYLIFTDPSGFALTLPNQGADDAVDSDAQNLGTPGESQTQLVNLSPGENDPTIDVGYYRPVGVGNFVWNDLDTDGIQDPPADTGEFGVDGVTVNLIGTNGNPYNDTTTTIDGGFYNFLNIPPGDYIIEFILPNGFQFSPQDQGGDDNVDSDPDPTTGQTTVITLVSGDGVDDSWDAGIFQNDPSIDVTVVVDNPLIYSGDDVTYTYTVDNDGNVPLDNVTLNDNVCTNITFVSGDTNNDGILDVDETWTYTCSTTLNNDTTNTATAAGLDPNGDPVQDTDTADVDTIDPGIMVEVTPDQTTVPPGTDVTYTYNVTNEGDVPLDNVQLSDDVCSPVTFVSGDTNNDNILDLDETWVYTCTTTINEDTTNVATVTGDDPLDGTVSDDDAAFVDVVNPGIEVDKSASTLVAYVGDTIIYTYEVSNSGDTPIRNVSVVDDHCAPLTLQSGDDNNDNVLDVGETWIYTCQVALQDDTHNTVRATGDPDGGDPVSDEDMEDVDIIDPAIQITVQPDQPVVLAGTDVEYTYQVTNEGDDPLSNVVVTDDRCSPVTFVSGDDNNDGILDLNETWIYTCTATINEDTPNTADVDSDDSLGNPVTDEDNAFVDVINPDYNVEKTADATQISAGGDVTYSYAVENTGDVPISNVVVTDDTCSPVTFVSGDTNNDGNLDVDEIWNYTCTTTLSQDTTNTVTVRGEDPLGNPMEDKDMLDVDTIDPGISVDVTPDQNVVNPGDDVTYTYEVVNTGDTPLDNVQLTDDTCSPVTFVSGDTDNDGELDLDETWVYTCTTPINEDTTNTATVTGDDPLNNTVTDDDTAFVDVINPGIDVEVTPDQTTVDPGTDVTYTYDVTNNGEDPLDNVQLTDDVCSPVTPVEDGNGNNVGDTNENGSLDVGETWQYTCTTPINEDTTNTVTATGDDPLGNPVSDTDSAFVDVIEPISSIGNFVWEDLDEDGIQDDGEPGVEGVTVNLVDSDGMPAGSTTTDENGRYEFTDLASGTYTVFFVKPAGFDFTTQDAGGDDTVDSDPDANGETAPVTLADNENNPDVDAGLVIVKASLGDKVWEDTDKDGIQDDGEPGIEGVTVNLWTANPDGTPNAQIGSTTTNGAGVYEFTGLDPREDYVVQFVAPTGRDFTTQNAGGDDTVDSDADTTTGISDLVDLDPGENDPTIDAGILPAVATIGDFVWDDQNEDGIQDPNEPGIGGVDVTLWIVAPDGTPISQQDTTTTAPDGSYEFTDVPAEPGNSYLVQFSAPADKDFSPQNQGDGTNDSDPAPNGDTAPFSVSPGEEKDDVDAGLIPARASIGDLVFDDQNEDGVRDVGEPGIPGVTVNLLDVNGNQLDTTQTDGNGQYLFPGLDPDEDYIIEVVPPVGRDISPQDAGVPQDDTVDSDVDPTTGRTDPIDLDPGEDDDTVDAGLLPVKAFLGDTVWEDTDEDGIQDEGEPGVPGVDVNLWTADDNGNPADPVGSTTTDANGNYSFTGLNPNETYIVEFVAPPGRDFTAQDQGGDDTVDSDANPTTGLTAPITLDPGETDETVDAGLLPATATISGEVFDDLDEDGIQDGVDPGVGGVTVNLLDEDGNIEDTTTTDPTGAYEFDNVAPGTYTVQVEPPADQVFSPQDEGGDDTVDSDVDPTGETDPITVAPGDEVEDVDAGLVDAGNRAFEFEKFIEGKEADTLGDAVQAHPSNFLRFKYKVTNTGDSAIEWSTLDDDVFGPLTAICGLPTIIPVGGSSECTIISAAGDEPDGKQNIGTVTILGVGTDQDPAWYITDPDNGTIGDFVFNDLTQDGIQDPEDPGITGIQVNLLDLVGNVVDTTVTSADNPNTPEVETDAGYYQFVGVPSDTGFRVEFVPPEDQVFVTLKDVGNDDTVDSDANPSSGRSDVVILDPGEFDDTIDAGLYNFLQSKPATLGDVVWEDLNGNGIQDGGEPGVEGVTVQLLSPDGTVLQTTTTDADGEYLFTGLIPDDYKVRFVLPDGYDDFTDQDQGVDDTVDSDADPTAGPNQGETDVITLGLSETNLTVDAGIIRFVSVGNFVWEDLDADGVQDAGEPGIADVEVTLFETGVVTPVGTTNTDSNGLYGFSGLHPGEYYVQFEQPTGFEFTEQDAGADDTVDSDANPLSGPDFGTTQAVLIPSGTDNDTIDAGVIRPGSIGDTVFLDEDNDGIQDNVGQPGGEEGVPDVVVNLLDEDGNQIATTTTDENGNYNFPVFPGTYIVEFEAPNGFVFSPQDQGGDDNLDSDPDPTTGQTAPITVGSGEDRDDVDAGVGGLGSIGDFVWSDTDGDGIQDPGEPGIDDVKVTLLDGNGNFITETVTTDGGQYLFDNLLQGDYQVSVEIPLGFQTSPQDQGGDDTVDSDINSSGNTDTITLGPGEDNLTVDAGFEPLDPGIVVEKSTNGEDADEPTGPAIPVGDPVVWEYVVTNVGNVNLIDIQVVDDQLGNITSSCPDAQVELLIVGDTMTCTVNGVATEGQYRNEVTVQGFVEGLSGEFVEDDDVSHYIGVGADLSVEKTDSEDPADAGQELFYTIVYSNAGPSDATDVVIEDVLPDGVLFNNMISSDPDIGNPTVSWLPNQPMIIRWEIPFLAVGESGEIVFEVDTDPSLAGAQIINTVSITSSVPDTDPLDNEEEELTDFRLGGVGNPTAIELLSFTTRLLPDGTVEVRWVTGAEINTLGFDLYRVTGNAAEFSEADSAHVSEGVVINGESIFGSEYSFVDTSALPGVTYTYWLRETEIDGTVNTYGPADVKGSGPAIDDPGPGSGGTDEYSLFLPLVTR